MSVIYKRVSSDDELKQILQIQKRNMKVNLTDSEMLKEGFITVGHDFDIVKKMNEACAHIIAKNVDTVAGYALAMTREFRNEMPVLIPMFESADRLLQNRNYIAMGQICIDKPYRKQGLFKGMYTFYKEQLRDDFDCLFTEVATSNVRSLEAHKKVGFKVLETQITEGISWELVNWDWK